MASPADKDDPAAGNAGHAGSAGLAIADSAPDPAGAPPVPPSARPKRRGWLPVLLFLLVAFGLGAVAMGYALTRWPVAARYLAGSQETAQPDAPPAALAAPRAILVPPEGMEQRIAALEERLSRIGAHMDAAEGNADRAEGLLVAFAARRALDRGVQLGYIEPLLRDRFGAAQPRAVALIIAAGRAPVTLDELQAELSAIAPELAAADSRESWWDSLRRSLSGLIVIRHQGTPSPAPADRLHRTKMQLEAGHVGAALAEVARMPGHERAGPWIARARRYAAARNALDIIETAALLAPRDRPAKAAEVDADTPPAPTTPIVAPAAR